MTGVITNTPDDCVWDIFLDNVIIFHTEPKEGPLNVLSSFVTINYFTQDLEPQTILLR